MLKRTVNNRIKTFQRFIYFTLKFEKIVDSKAIVAQAMDMNRHSQMKRLEG